MKKVILVSAVVALLSTCGGGGNGSGTAIGQSPNGGVAGSGDTFVSAVFNYIVASDAMSTEPAEFSTYDTITATADDNTAPDSIPM